jgi:hypothetical protein
MRKSPERGVIGATAISLIFVFLLNAHSAYAFSFTPPSFLSNAYCSVLEWVGGSCDVEVLAQSATVEGGLLDEEKVDESLNGGSESQEVLSIEQMAQEIDKLKESIVALEVSAAESQVAPVCSDDSHASREDLYTLVQAVTKLAELQQQVSNPPGGTTSQNAVTLAELNNLKTQLQLEINAMRYDSMAGVTALSIARSIIGAPQQVGDQLVDSPGYSGDITGSSLSVSGTGTSTFAGGMSVVGGGTFGGMISTLHNGVFGGSLIVGGDLAVDTTTFFVDATNDRVGIGTTTPEDSLDVVGSARIGHSVYLADYAPTTSTSRLYNSGGNLYWNGIQVDATSSPGLWTASGPDIYRETGNVGIGTTTASEKLTIVGGNIVHSPDSSSYQKVGSLQVLSNPVNAEMFHLRIHGRYGYMLVKNTGANSRMDIYDFEDPTRPTIAGSVDIPNLSSPLDMAVEGDYVYVSNQLGVGVQIINVENKKNPKLVNTFPVGSQLSGIQAHQGFLYVEGFNTRELYVIDVRQPESPKLASTLPLGVTGNWDFTISGGYLYILEYGWLDVVDISDPYNLEWRGWVGMGYASGIEVSGDMAYVISGSNDRIQIVDVSDPDAPVYKTDFSLGDNPTSFEVEGDYLYWSDSVTREVYIVDVSSSTAPRLVHTLDYSLGRPYSIDVEGPYMYIADIITGTLDVYSVPSINTTALVSSSLQTGDVNVKKHLTVKGDTFLETLKVSRGGLMSWGRGTFLVDQAAGDLVPPALTVMARDERFGATTDMLELSHVASGTPQDGIGAGVVFKTDLDSGEATTTARIASITTDVSAGTPAAALAFYLKNGVGPVSEHMRITSDGNVGIGTNNPQSKLTVVGETMSDYFTATSTTATSTFGGGLKVGNGSEYISFFANAGGAEISTENDRRIRINNQVRFDSDNFDINTPPLVFRTTTDTDDIDAKGSMIEWQQYLQNQSYVYGSTTKAYRDWLKGGQVGAYPTFTPATTGDKRIAWWVSHYDSPSSTGEDVHQHISLETAKADLSTIITRFAVSWGEDTALVSFPNSELQISNDRKLSFSHTDDTYIKYDSSAGNVVFEGKPLRIGDFNGDEQLILGAQNNSTSGSSIIFSENESGGNGFAIVHDTLNNYLNIEDTAADINRWRLYRDTGDIQLLSGDLLVDGVGDSRIMGSLGIGTSTPSAQLTTTGSVRFATFGAGGVQTDANGNLLVSSDERLKYIDTTYSRGLDAVLGLSPIIYHWRPETGFDTENAYTGFSAQNVQEYIPEAVGESRDGFLTLSDRPIVAAIVNAIKELNAKIDALSTGVVSQLGSVISVDRANVQEVCWDDVCVTKEQIQQLLENSSIEAASPAAPVFEEEIVVEETIEVNNEESSLEEGVVEEAIEGVTNEENPAEEEGDQEVVDEVVGDAEPQEEEPVLGDLQEIVPEVPQDVEDESADTQDTTDTPD